MEYSILSVFLAQLLAHLDAMLSKYVGDKCLSVTMFELDNLSLFWKVLPTLYIFSSELAFSFSPLIVLLISGFVLFSFVIFVSRFLSFSLIFSYILKQTNVQTSNLKWHSAVFPVDFLASYFPTSACMDVKRECCLK